MTGPCSIPPCSIQRSLDILGDRWTMLILRESFRGVRRFDELRRNLDIARPVLTERLKRLVEHGVLVKHLYCERPPRYEYRLTQMGMALSPALVALMRWGDEWLSVDGPPTVLVHEACGHPLDQQFVCWHCSETFTPHEIASRPGPGRQASPVDAASIEPVTENESAHTAPVNQPNGAAT